MGDLYRLRQILQMAQQPLPTPVPVIEPLVPQLLTFYTPEQDLDKLEKLAAILLDSCRSAKQEVGLSALFIQAAPF